MPTTSMPTPVPRDGDRGAPPWAAPSGSTRSSVTIGFVGTASSGHRLSQVAEHLDAPVRLLSAVSDSAHGAYERALRLAEQTDVVLFSGPLSYDLSMRQGELPVPCLYIPPGGSALPTALLRAALHDSVDLSRVSVDTLSQAEVLDLYDELEVDTRDLHVMEYRKGATTTDYLSFHRRLFDEERIDAAVTTLPDVASELSAKGVPTVTMRPDAVALRTALSTARLVGGGASLENERLVILVVRVPRALIPRGRGTSNVPFTDLKLRLMQEMLREARRMGGLVLPRDDTSFLVCVSMGSLRAATEEFSMAPFVDRIHEQLGFTPDVGIGIGQTALEAESHAEAAAEKSSEDTGRSAIMVGPDDSELQIPWSRGDGPRTRPAEISTQSELLHRILDALSEAGEDKQIVEAEQVATALGVNLRTARRHLRVLVDADLAWELPPKQSRKVGRPPTPYRLLNSRL